MEQFLQGNVPLSHLLCLYWQGSAIKLVNDWALNNAKYSRLFIKSKTIFQIDKKSRKNILKIIIEI